MQNSCFLSIIIPVYNVEKYVERCIRSCEKQDIGCNNYEIVCVNDGSKDNSIDIINRLATEYSNIVVISQPNRGLSAARNTGMRHASGVYYMFVDSDDWIAENCLGKLIEKLKEEKPDALAICAANVYGDEYKRRMSYESEKSQKGREYLRTHFSPCAPFSIWAASFLKKNNLLFYEGILHEDSEFTPRAYYLADTISRTNELIYYVFQNPNSITRTVNPQKSYDLVEVVCEHLYDFCEKTVDPDYKSIFYKMISMYINNALATILNSSKEEQMKLNTCLYSHRHLFTNLLKSPLLKNRVEGVLFSLFPRQYTNIYKLMKSI